MKTIVYVDGFNLYYRALKYTRYKWLDIKRLVTALLKPENKIVAIKYYTARVSGRQDRDAPRRQQIYLNALQTIPEVEVIFGRFLAKTIKRPLVTPVQGLPRIVEVHQNEEKGSDVNLASHLLHDGWKGVYEVAAVLSNDTDLCEPIRLVREDLKRPVGVICPATSCAPQLRSVASFLRYISEPRLAAAQFPDPIPGTSIRKPTEW